VWGGPAEQLDQVPLALDAGATADVGDLERDRGRAGRLVLPEVGLAVGAVRVGEAVAEAEQRHLALLVVPAVADQDALVVAGVAVGARPALGTGDRALVRRGREGDRQPAARVGVAEQDRGQRLAELLPGQPGLHYRPHLVEPGHQDRAAGVEHDHGAGVGGGDGDGQPVLVAREGERGPVHPLAHGLTGEHHGDIAGRRRLGGLLDAGVRWVPSQLDVAAADPWRDHRPGDGAGVGQPDADRVAGTQVHHPGDRQRRPVEHLAELALPGGDQVPVDLQPG
jgi:hypothetical protein